ncbi:phosphate ABC transporter permease subunit PstC [Azotosporobacter soli]|uniref:phosphate ABC transporter permease subunit PstC n=1 Tax=Azotosporobacter soli TaxID=3055040 RepID=UPI003D160851
MLAKENKAMAAKQSLHARKLMADRYVRYLFLACAMLLTVIVLSIIVFIGQQGLQTFSTVSPLEFFFSARWDPMAGQFGALSFIAGSLAVTLLAVLLGGPLGLLGAIFMAKVSPKWARDILRPATDLYVAVPSVVYGFIGITILVPWIRETFGVSTGFGLLAAGIILGVMILPTVISISEDAVRSVPASLEEASLALGATRWQTIWHVLLPAARPGILTAIVLGMARAVGETMAVQMVIGNTPQLVAGLFQPTSTLPSEIVVEMGNTPFGTPWGNSLFMMALVLLVMSLVLILAIRRLGERKVAV